MREALNGLLTGLFKEQGMFRQMREEKRSRPLKTRQFEMVLCAFHHAAVPFISLLVFTS